MSNFQAAILLALSRVSVGFLQVREHIQFAEYFTSHPTTCLTATQINPAAINPMETLTTRDAIRRSRSSMSSNMPRV